MIDRFSSAPRLLRRAAPVLTLVLLAACSGAPARYAVPPAQDPTERVASRWGTVVVRDVSLPSYAASEEIHIRSADGALTSSPDLLWADDPERAVSLDLAGRLARLTGAQVAAEPWPFVERAEASVDVRVVEMLAEEGGTFRLSGQYFVAPDAGGRGRSGMFDIAVPFAPEGGPPAIAAARGQAVRTLAGQIARDGLR